MLMHLRWSGDAAVLVEEGFTCVSFFRAEIRPAGESTLRIMHQLASVSQ